MLYRHVFKLHVILDKSYGFYTIVPPISLYNHIFFKLQAEGSEVSAELEFLNQQNIILSMENKTLKQRLESTTQEQLIKYCKFLSNLNTVYILLQSSMQT